MNKLLILILLDYLSDVFESRDYFHVNSFSSVDYYLLLADLLLFTFLFFIKS